MNSSYIEVRDINKSYNTQKVLTGVSFSIEKGSIVGLLGPNGSGKTTLVRLMNGVILPDQGTMWINGFDPVTDGNAIRRLSGVVTEGAGLYHEMSGIDNLRFFAKLYNCYDEQRIRELLQQYGLEKAQDKKVGSYSTGMKKRLALAKALLHQPEILFLDEPTNGLDPEGIKQVVSDLKAMNEAHGTTIILCSHVLQQLESLCHSYIFLSNGTVLDIGTKEELNKRHFTTVQLRLTTGLSVENNSYHGYLVQRLGPSEILLELPSTDLISVVLRKILEETWVHTVEIMNHDLESLYFHVRGEKS
ncbi:ABC transporter ATP-binding protein [Paenibacillus sp. FSL H7-0326]|uniref:ABC transporter ATP-binding protein n=1 Tax=Paenibacillus sp. FSL H7-0326 TaxID=1921144 RepID=UPI00096E46EF|nr:ABC transporter ATP-binding protein [Paenibacillus sp. FSL H7-0326]OMC67543.1 ABC transporter ATP-binding protein [Paenibacillus sp. FSL H7-0326]